MNKKMEYDTNEMPPIGKSIILAFQHLFAMFGATILVPILVNQAAGSEVLTIPVALVTSGIGTLIYILCTKGRSPVYLGSSFAFITPIAAAYLKGGISGAMTGVMVVGLIYIIIALIIKFVGKDWLEKLLPPVVIGPMIMIIGLGLAPSAISQIGLSSGTDLNIKVLIVAMVSFLVTAIVMTKAKGFFKIIPFLVGIICGYIVAVCLGMIDFTPVKEASFFSLPKFKILFKDYSLNFSALITIAPIALVTLCEHIGDHTSLGNIIGKDLIKNPGLDRTLLGDGIATFVAGFLGGPANTTYGENTSVVGMTKVASVKVIGLAGIFAIIIGFLGKFTALISTIPSAVLGGVSLLLYGFIAVNGLKVLIKNKVDFENSKNIIVASSMLVLGLGGAAISITKGDLSLVISGMSLASIVGILLNIFLPKENETEVATLVEKEVKTSKTDMLKLKKDIKDELTVELKEDILEAIKDEMSTYKKKGKK
ncbi:MAG: uracil-xanthine permease [Bacilli bacterium]|nr:uracil-xanthine permease [Bacilli bacterium]